MTTVATTAPRESAKNNVSDAVPGSVAKQAVAARIAALRTLAESDPLAAQDATWAWFQRLGAELPGEAAEAELAAIFAAGQPADVDGQTEGLLVGWLAPQDLDRAGSFVYRSARTVVEKLGVLPWLGKKFDKSAQRGTNTMSLTAWLVAAPFAPMSPGYRLKNVGGGKVEGFDMLNFVEESVVSPGTQVLVLDYENIGTNPWPINQIRDEAVQIVPGTYLGAKLWHQEDGYRQLAFWAAKIPA
ncbi:hypothetical protein [Marinobacter sp. SS21]|uniref:hypothetical protein n=1 Tax=Marinobacter sp. SS21 TaxID=2979460 RepID=UPI00232F2714|nr:hypothetical protein [Marinobacter sp. SS21]MDC0661365.1 hypothetical protein [Marinobacter sp. SS21]